MVTRKPILPGEGELSKNPRSKSAKLRVFERSFETAGGGTADGRAGSMGELGSVEN